MDAGQFDRLARVLGQGVSRRTLTSLLGGVSLSSSLLSQIDLVQAKKGGGKKKKPCPPCKKRKNGKCKGTKPDGTPCENGGSCQSGQCITAGGGTTGGGSGSGSGNGSGSGSSGAAVVASYCVGGGGTSQVFEYGQPFIAQRGGRLDRLEVTSTMGPGGQYAIEVRDLNQGRSITTAPALGATTVTVPAITGDHQLVTAQFTTDGALVAEDQYAIVVRFLGTGDGNYFLMADAVPCPGPSPVLFKERGETAFTPVPGVKLAHTVYVVP